MKVRGRKKKTYHNGHACTLHNGTKRQNANSDLPPCRPSLHTTRNDDDEADERAKLHHDAKRDQESNGPPHVAKRRVLCAVAGSREGHAGTRDGRAAAM